MQQPWQTCELKCRVLVTRLAKGYRKPLDGLNFPASTKTLNIIFGWTDPLIHAISFRLFKIAGSLKKTQDKNLWGY